MLHVVVLPGHVADVRRNAVPRVGPDPRERRHVQPDGERQAGALAQRPAHLFGEGLGRVAPRDEPVSDAARAPDRALGPRTDPDRRSTRTCGTGCHDHVRALRRHRLASPPPPPDPHPASPRAAQDLDRALQPGHAIAEPDTEPVELLWTPSEPEPEDEPPA